MTVRAIFGVVIGLALTVAGVALFAWLLWWLWSRREEEAQEQAAIIEIEADEPVKASVVEIEIEMEEEEAGEEEAPPKPDDLKVIEGIGPKIASVLQAAGLVTYAQLADATAEQIEQILEEADPRLRRLAKPTTWHEQAALAACGQWEALEALQNKLKGGQRA